LVAPRPGDTLGALGMRAFVFSLSTLVVIPTVASAAPSTRECAAAYEETQLAMRRSRLLHARETLHTCLDEACPKALRSDCSEWLKEVEARTPSVVVEWVAEAASVRDARLFVDDVLQAGGVDGKAIAVDPGPHVFRIEAPHAPPVSVTTVIREGDKLRVVRLEPPTRSPAEPAPRAESSEAATVPDVAQRKEVLVPRRPVPWPVFALAGVGVATGAAFTYFAVSGASGKSDLYRCKPECPEAQISDVRTDFLVADVFLGVTVVALGAAAYLLFTRPTVLVPDRPRDALTVGPTGVRLAF